MLKIKFLVAIAGLLFGCSSCREEIVHDLAEVRANQVLLILERAGIEGDKRRDGAGWSLAVPESESRKALTVLEQSRVLEHDLNRFRETAKSFVPSREERLQAGERALAWNLETTLERIPHVLEARVHVQSQSSAGESEKVAGRSAGVLLVVDSEARDVREIARSLISGGTGVPGDQVTVAVTQIPVATVSSAASLPRDVQRNKNLSFTSLIAALLFGLLVMVRRRRLQREASERPPLRPVVSALNGHDRFGELQ